MREIKFRAWDTDNNLFVICEDHQIRQINNDYAGLGNRYVYQQYTGLKDKNGKEIYEGDICRWPSKHLSSIQWHEKRACFTSIAITQSKGVSRGGIVPTHIEVIGNIYETPELLTHDR